MHKVTLIKGDGIGPEIVKAVKEVLVASKAPVEFEEFDAGIAVYEESGDPLPREIIESIKKNKVALKGPITTPVGKGFRSVNVRLRKELDLFANLRPVKSFKGIKSRYEDIDLVIVRENTEDLYAGIEHKLGEYGAESIKLITKEASDKIINFGLDYCKNLNRKRYTCIHKANIMKLTDGLFLDRFRDITAKSGADIIFDDLIVDACAMNLVIKPNEYDTMVLPNLYGDIISDLCAGLIGGLGLVPGANIGDDYAIFEPVHGSAPDIAGKGIANPTAIILAAVMMLNHLEEYESSNKISKALDIIFDEAKYLTVDLGGKASTEDFTKRLVEIIETL